MNRRPPGPRPGALTGLRYTPLARSSLPSTDMNALARLHERIRACTKCVGAGYLERARPIVAGKASDRVAIVGQAPGSVELETGMPFSGRSGDVLRRWMSEAGLGPDELPYRTAITKCFPGKAASGEGDRRPSPAEIALCAPWLGQELALLRPEVVLLVGQMAIERYWGRSPLHEAVGRARREGDRLYIPLPHPSGTSRWLNDARNRGLLRRALRILATEVARSRREGKLRRDGASGASLAGSDRALSARPASSLSPRGSRPPRPESRTSARPSSPGRAAPRRSGSRTRSRAMGT